ncbi:unnamed protein product [Effrenium voratum]|nr:unnamed protein product [Effrenium voratum]
MRPSASSGGRSGPRRRTAKAARCQQPEFAPMDILEREFENSQILPGSSLEIELNEAGVSRRMFYGGLLRYNYYVASAGIGDGAVAPVNNEWLENVGATFLVEADRLFKDLPPEVVAEIVEQVTGEMKAGYVRACKRAIADYIFKARRTMCSLKKWHWLGVDPRYLTTCQMWRDSASRDRALVPFVPPVPDWGTVPFEGIEGTEGAASCCYILTCGPPDEWRDGIEENRNAIARPPGEANLSQAMALALLELAALDCSGQLLYLPGCGSLPGGRKERFLQAYAARHSHRLCCVEYSKPLGSEEALAPEELSSLHACLEDAKAAPQASVVVAASMGAWVAAGLAAEALLLLAPSGPSAARARPGKAPGTCILPSEHSTSGGYVINSVVPKELQEHSIAARVPVTCLCRIIHGDKDEAVPIEDSEVLLESLQKRGVQASLRRVPGGDHRLSSEPELRILEEELDQLIAGIQLQNGAIGCVFL